MNTVRILDATLRDGGHRTNFHFSDVELQQILTPLDQAGLEYIEIGYRNGSIHPIADLGRAGYSDKAYLNQCKSLITRTKMAVMAHPQNLNQDDVSELKSCGVDLLRLCVLKNKLDVALPVIAMAKKADLALSINIIHLSYYSALELDAVIEQIAAHKPSMIYFADSNGSMLPEQIKSIYTRYTQKYALSFGFHAHDNLGMAQANTLSALSAGAAYIDASLAGMGKGIGNLKIEYFVAFLHATHRQQHHLPALLAAANYIREVFHVGSERLDLDEFVRGISDLSTADLKLLRKNLA